MKRTGEGMRQNNGISQTMEFIRENAMALEKGSRSVITNMGERFLQILSETAARSNSGLGCALR
jgi:hypothetical protein